MNDGNALTALAPDGEDIINGSFSQLHMPHIAQQQPTSSTLVNYPNFMVNNVVGQFRYESLENSETRQSSITELDQTAPWTPLEINVGSFSQSIKPQWVQQQDNRPASIQDLQAHYQSGKDSSVTTRPRSDSGYGTVPNPHKSPHTVSTTTHSIFDGEMPSMSQDLINPGQELISLDPKEREALFPTMLNEDYNQNESLLPDQLTAAVEFESMSNQPPENGPFVCNRCLQNGTEGASQKNKSEWKYDNPSPHHCPHTNRITLTQPEGNISSGIQNLSSATNTHVNAQRVASVHRTTSIATRKAFIELHRAREPSIELMSALFQIAIKETRSGPELTISR